MRKFAFLLVTLTLSCGIYSQNAPSPAPLNPDFVRFLEKQKNGEYALPGIGEFGTGGMPPPGQVNFDDYLKDKLKSTSFAPVYDLRTTGLLTPVRGQTSNGCWAFATIGSVESKWLVLGLGSWDLSENNLKYCHGFLDSRSYYGNHWMSTAYFARRSGPLVEADDPNSGGSPGPGLCPSGKVPVGYITDARYLPNDMNTIKQAVLDQGAIYTMMYIDLSSNYYNAANFTYYYYGSAEVNHAVDLVGWDDTKVTAGGTGAWICKNSYGTGWGEAGYFYVSYNSHSFLDYNAYWPSRIDNVPATQIYGYDDLGNYNSTGYGSSVGYMLVKFVSAGTQLGRKIGTYAMAGNSEIEIDVFDSFDPVTLIPSGLVLHQAGLSCALPGYYTFDLPTAITMQNGDDFYIRIRYQTPLYNYPIPFECFIDTYSNPVIESNISWMSADGSDGSWFLIGNTTTDYKWDPCVKMYAEPFPEMLTWNGTVSNEWNDAANWSPANVPDAAKDVLIPGVARKPVINQSPATPAVCKNLTIDEGSSVTINSGKALTVYGTLTNSAGTTGLIIEPGASLLTKGAVNGQATINRSITGAKWHFISSPVADAVSGMFQGKYLQQFTESGNTYTDITTLTEPLTVGKGFSLWGDDIGFPVQYSGTLNNGSSAVVLTRSASGGNSGWNLVGNPYPSSIDWDASGWTKYNLNNAIYIENAGGWATYISGAGTNGGTRFIAPNQGFFVNVASIGSGNLAMNNYVRVHDATTFFKSIKNTGSFVRLQVSGNGYSDEAIVRFMPEVTNEFDSEYDALKLFGYIDASAQIYTLGSIPLTINSMLPETIDIPLGIHANASGTYTIAASDINNMNDITLEDVKTGILTRLTDRNYTFTFVTGENELRFKLHVRALSVNETETQIAGVFSYHQNVYIDIKEQDKGDIFIYTINGQLAASKTLARGMNEIIISDPGIYIVKVITRNSMLVRKVWIQ
jgi:C1A family cysteine protease